MSLKDEELYQKYLLYLESKSLTKGGFELSKISQSLFEEFQSRYENNPSFKEKINNQYKSFDRQEKIDDLVKDDFDLFIFSGREKGKKGEGITRPDPGEDEPVIHLDRFLLHLTTRGAFEKGTEEALGVFVRIRGDHLHRGE